MTNLKLSDNEINQLDIIQDLNSEISILQDKLKRRNTQIADLKARLKEVKEEKDYWKGNYNTACRVAGFNYNATKI